MIIYLKCHLWLLYQYSFFPLLVSPFFLARPAMWYVLWLLPLPIVTVQSFSLTDITIGGITTTWLF